MSRTYSLISISLTGKAIDLRINALGRAVLVPTPGRHFNYSLLSVEDWVGALIWGSRRKVNDPAGQPQMVRVVAIASSRPGAIHRNYGA